MTDLELSIKLVKNLKLQHSKSLSKIIEDIKRCYGNLFDSRVLLWRDTIEGPAFWKNVLLKNCRTHSDLMRLLQVYLNHFPDETFIYLNTICC